MNTSRYYSNFMLFIVMVIVIAFAGQSYATKFVSAGAYNFREGELLDDDLIIAGESAKISGNINGDLIAFGRSVVVNGDIKGSAFCANQYTKVFGNIDGSMRAFCQNAQLNGNVKRSVLVFCASFNFGPEGRVGKDIHAYGAEVVIEGRVGNDLIVGAGETIISGVIEGDAEIESDNITLLPGAVIKGNLIYKSARQAKIEDGANILGTTSWNKVEIEEGKKDEGHSWIRSIAKVSILVLIFTIAIQFAGFLIYLIGGIISTQFAFVALFTLAVYLALVLLIAISKRQARETVNAVMKTPIKSFSLGLVGFIVIPIAAVFCMIIPIGMPIALLLAFMFGLLCFAGWLYGALALGDFALSRFKQNGETSLYLSALIGVIILTLAAGIPYLGALIAFLTTFFGFGAIILVRYKNEKD